MGSILCPLVSVVIVQFAGLSVQSPSRFKPMNVGQVKESAADDVIVEEVPDGVGSSEWVCFVAMFAFLSVLCALNPTKHGQLTFLLGETPLRLVCGICVTLPCQVQ